MKIFSVVVLWLLFFISSFLIAKDAMADISSVVPSIAGLVGSFLFLCQFTYERINSVFVYVNKKKVLFFNPTIDWSLESRVTSKEYEGGILNEIYDTLYERFQHYDIKNISGFSNENELKLSIDNHVISIFILRKSEEDHRYIIKFFSKVSYRESQNDLENIYEEVIKSIKSRIIKPTNEWYSLKVYFKNHNPFYKVYLRTTTQMKDFIFKMEFEEEETKFIVHNNQIEIISTSVENVKKYGKNYVAISTKKLLQ